MRLNEIDWKQFFIKLADPCFVIDSEGTILDFNEAVTKQLGYRSEQVQGNKITFLMPSPHAERHQSYIDSYLDTGIRQVIGKGRKVDLVKADGKSAPFFLTVSEQRLPSGGRYFLGVLSDISELENARNEFESIIQSLPAVIIKTDRELSIRYINKFPQEFREEGVIGRNCLSFLGEDQAALVLKAIEKLKETNKPQSYESVLEQNGGVRHFSSIVSKVDLGDDEIEYIIVAYETTELKELQMQLEHSARLASLGELAAGVGHEINNPLQIMLLRLEKAEDLVSKLESQEVPFLKECIESLRNTAMSIAKIVDGLRDFSCPKIQGKSQQSITTIVQDALRLFTPLVTKNDIELLVDYPSQDAPVFVDVGIIHQILVNLLVNARDAVSKSSSPKIYVQVKQEGGKAVILVQDSGNGVEHFLSNKIFSPFFTTKPRGQGTGLGLSISKFLAEKEGGSLLLLPKSEEPRRLCGATFEVSLPIRLVQPTPGTED